MSQTSTGISAQTKIAPTIKVERYKREQFIDKLRRFSSKLSQKRKRLRPWQISLIYVGSVLLASLLLAWVFIAAADDVFSLTKPDRAVSLTLSEGQSAASTASALHKAGVIEHPLLFRIYMKLRKRTLTVAGGTYELSSAMNYDQIIAALKSRQSPPKNSAVT